MVLKRMIVGVALLLVPLTVASQVDEAIEDWLQEDGSEEVAAEMSDMALQYAADPVSINDTAALAEMPFIAPFQLLALRNYITLHGQLLSLKELLLVPGFDSVDIVRLSRYTKATPCSHDTKWRWWEGRHTLVTAVGGTVEKAKGYSDGSYDGDNMRALMCYTYNYRDKINLRLVADKDPGEEWGKANYYSYHLSLSDVGRLERLIVGRYNLQFGQGLTLWTGLRPFNILGQPPLRFGSGVRQASTFYEDDYQQGVAATVRVGSGVHLSGFVSRLDGETLLGGHAEYRRGNLVVGLTGVYTALDSLPAVRDYTYNQNRFRADRLGNFGVNVAYRYRYLLLYGEAAMSSELCPAAIAGAMLKVAGSTSLGVSYRHYDALYHNRHAQGYSIGNTQGEHGICLDMQTTLPLSVLATLSVDLHAFPSLRYGSYSPSSGAWLRARLSRQFGEHLSAIVRYVCRVKERNTPNIDSTLYVAESTLRQQVQMGMTVAAGRWRVDTRAMYALFDSQSSGAQSGWAVAQTIRYVQGKMQAAANVAWFDVDGYYARLYLSESNLQYAWSMPVLNGRGVRCGMLLRCDVARWLALAVKYSLFFYPGQESVGSGSAQTEGPLRQNWMLQVRCKF